MFEGWNRIFSNLWRPKKWGRGLFYRFYSSSNTWHEVDCLESFLCVPEVNAAINLKARAHSNGIYKVVDENNNDIDDDLNRVLQRPNFFQAQKEFIRQSVLFHEIFGNEYIYLLFPVGFPDRLKKISTIPPNLVSAEYTSKLPFYLSDGLADDVQYTIRYGGKEEKINQDQIIHLNDNRVTVKDPTDKDLLKGEPKLQALRAVVNNIKMAYESRGVILKHRGAVGILSNAGKDGTGSPLPLDQGEVTRLQEEYKRGYGGLEDQSSLIISESNLRWQQMGSNPDRLGLFEEIEKDFDKILDAFGIPPEMFASKEGSTFENQRQAEKGLYLRTIIPEANERAAALTSRLLAGSPNRIIVDFSHLPIFQDDLQSRATSLRVMVEALSKALMDGAITLDQYMAELVKYGIDNPKQN